MFNTTIATQIYAKICFEATNSQKKIIENLSEYLSDDDFSRIFVLNGFAGTGKTTLIAALVAALKELRIKPVLLAPTGRAAKVLARYCGGAGAYDPQTHLPPAHQRRLRIEILARLQQGTRCRLHRGRSLDALRFDGRRRTVRRGSLLEDLVSYVRSGRSCRLILVGDSARSASRRVRFQSGARSGDGFALRRSRLRADGRGGAPADAVGYSVQCYAGALHARKTVSTKYRNSKWTTLISSR